MIIDRGEDMLSVIVPVYNAQKYLDKCIQSIVNQKYKEYELILVDDGSSDNSAAICDSYADSYGNITVIHQTNQGPICARRNGVNAAKGEYITFVDADDWVDENIYIHFQEYMNKNVDLITFRKCVDKENSGIIDLEESYKEGLYNREEIEKNILPTVIWNIKKNKPDLTESLDDKIFKKSLLEYSYNLASQVPKLHYGEDPLILFPILEKIETLYISNKVLYHYRQHLNETPAYIKSNEFFQKANAWFEYLADKVDRIPDGRKQLEYLYLHLLDNRREMYGDYVKNNEFMFPFDKVKSGSNIILYGAGKVGDTYISQLERINYCNVIAWVDKNYEVYLPDKKVESIEIIREIENYDYIVIAIDSKDIREKVLEWLVSVGVNSKKIV